MKSHPLAATMPPMSADEYDSLLANIKRNGLLYPIVVYQGAILDGRHRMKACTALGIKPEISVFKGDKVSAEAFVSASNVHRRHLSRDQKRKIIAAELKRDPAQSDRAIARKAKASHHAVASARRAEPNGQNAHYEERRESSGRKARGRKPAPAPLALASVSKPKDLEAKRLIKEIESIDPSELSDPGSFGGDLYVQCKRFGERLKMRR